MTDIFQPRQKSGTVITAIREWIATRTAPFTIHDLRHALPNIQRPSTNTTVYRLIDLGELKVVKRGTWKKPDAPLPDAMPEPVDNSTPTADALEARKRELGINVQKPAAE